jgi:hypothetical protein
MAAFEAQKSEMTKTAAASRMRRAPQIQWLQHNSILRVCVPSPLVI